MYCVILIVCSMSHDNFNYVDFIRVFEDFNELNITVIVKVITAVVTSQARYLGIFLLRYVFTE